MHKSQTDENLNHRFSSRGVPKVFFKTFGCRTNLFDTQVMRANLKNFLVTEDEEEADIVVVNSCTVTNGADSSVRSYVNKISKTGKKILFTGCGVQTQGESLFEKSLIFGGFAHSHKERIDEFLSLKERFFYQDSIHTTHVDSTPILDFDSKVRAFLKIQEGCDFSCSYCVIPQVRGKSRSYDENPLIDQIHLLAQKGIKEIVLTGTNVGSYGRDKGSSIAKLIKKIVRLTPVKRIRIGSLEPSQIDDEFLELLSCEVLEKHLHIALQHTSDRMLEIMNRKNRFLADSMLLEKIALRGYAIGTDYILGHPGEKKEVWEDALRNFKALPLTHIHPFVYSPRDNTPSAKLKQDVTGNLARERLHILMDIIKDNNYNFRLKQNKPLQVLIDSRRGEFAFGLDQFFNKIKIKSFDINKNDWFEVGVYEVSKEGNHATL